MKRASWRARAAPAPALLELRRQVDAKWPNRSKRSDGIMGDTSHQARKSDHNLGNAIDITHDPASGCDAYRLGEAFRRQMQSYPQGRISYVITNRQIASPRTSWRWSRYDGPNPHTSHLHVSIKASARDQTRPWLLS
jgi:hypothetical protein